MSKRWNPRSCLVLALLSLSTLTLPACAGESAPKKAAVATAGMTRVPHKPNGAGVDVSYRVDGTPAAGRTSSVVLTFEGVKAADASVRFSADNGLAIAGDGATRMLAPGQPTTLTLDVVPSADGIGYVHVFTTQNGVTSVTSIPVQVGKAQPTMRSLGGEPKPTAEGDKIISMPVK